MNYRPSMQRIKVVILNWNGEAHLRRFLPSVVAHTPPGAQVVVADNGSTDSSVDMLRREFPSVGLVAMDRNRGYAGGYNTALRELQAEYFVLMNSDIEATPGWLDPLVAALDDDRGLGAVAPKILSYADRQRFEYAGASGGFIDFLGYPFCRGRILGTLERDMGQYDTPRNVFWASGACMAVRADLFQRLGGFDEGFFAHMEEIDLCWRAQLAGYRIGVVPRSTVYHLGGGTLPNNNPRKLYLNYRNNLSMLYKNLPARRVEAILFVRMVLDGASALVFLLQGHWSFFTAVFRAHIDFHKRRGELAVLRGAIHENGVARPAGIYRRSIIFRYLLGCTKFKSVI